MHDTVVDDQPCRQFFPSTGVQANARDGPWMFGQRGDQTGKLCADVAGAMRSFGLADGRRSVVPSARLVKETVLLDRETYSREEGGDGASVVSGPVVLLALLLEPALFALGRPAREDEWARGSPTET